MCGYVCIIYTYTIFSCVYEGRNNRPMICRPKLVFHLVDTAAPCNHDLQ